MGVKMPERIRSRSEVHQSDNIKGDFSLVRNFAVGTTNFMARLVTMHETWLHHCDLQTKQQSVEWRLSFSPRPKKVRTQKSAGKILAPVFWDKDGVLPIKCLPKGRHHQCRILHVPAGRVAWSFEAETLWKVEPWCPLFAGQCTCTHITWNTTENRQHLLRYW